MKKLWLDLSDNINQREARERYILFATAIILVYAVFNYAFLKGFAEKRVTLGIRMQTASQELTQLTAQEKVLAKGLMTDPHAMKKRDISRLEQQIKDEDGRLSTLSVGLISAEELPKALYQVLSANEKLELVGMETLPPTLLKLQGVLLDGNDLGSEAGRDDSTTAASGSFNENVGIYKHAVRVGLRGRYFDIVDYLALLEGLDWKFYWQQLDYSVSKYPKADVVIEVYTLSLDAGVIGV